MRKKQVPPDKTRDSCRLSGARRCARNDSSPAFRRAGGCVGLVGHAEWPARSRSEDRPLHAERILCSWGALECAAMGPVVGVEFVAERAGVEVGRDAQVVGRRAGGRRYNGGRAGGGSRGCRGRGGGG